MFYTPEDISDVSQEPVFMWRCRVNRRAAHPSEKCKCNEYASHQLFAKKHKHRKFKNIFKVFRMWRKQGH